MKPCPICKEEIQEDAIKCRYCHSMLVPISDTENEADKRQVTYIVDRDLVRFGKFASGVLAIFLVIGAFLFGFKLDQALEKVRDTQQDLSKAQNELSQAQRDLKEAQLTVNSLKREVQKVLIEENGNQDNDRNKNNRGYLSDTGSYPSTNGQHCYYYQKGP